MVNLKVLNAIVNAKQAAITENVYNVICEEADTKYRFNLEKIVKAMLLAIRTEDINSDKVQNARNILLSLLTDGDENELTQRIYTCYFASVPCMTTCTCSPNQPICRKYQLRCRKLHPDR